MMIAIVFIFGLIIGSFLNVVIWRLHSEESVLTGRSHCPKCRHVLGPIELIPVLSFLIQKGKCRHCGKSISWQYPLVEFSAAILFLFAYLPYDLRLTTYNFFLLAREWFMISVMIIVFVYDLKYYLILDKIIYPAAALVFVTLPLIYGGGISWWGIFGPIVAAILGGGFFLLQYLISKGKWIGGGDIKMGALMGLILGLGGLGVALFFAYVVGAIVGLILVAGKIKKMKSQVPFGTFLAAGTVFAIFFGEKILNWYLNF
ncbi:prepilin peptidase [Patescibacteria group bacterium]|nr:prepilin peptidase [Patescibacteria group bacterium]